MWTVVPKLDGLRVFFSRLLGQDGNAIFSRFLLVHAAQRSRLGGLCMPQSHSAAVKLWIKLFIWIAELAIKSIVLPVK